MSDTAMTKFEQVLTKNKYRVTSARKSTFALLVNSEPQSIREMLIKSNGAIDRVSMYRNIELFEKLGIVRRIYIGWKFKLELSDTFASHHHHLSCLECGKIIDIHDEAHIDEFIKEVADRLGFKVRSHQFEIDGYCKDCKNEE
jgi:Fe2+ or Zn2+ uptake regulation protein